MVSRIGPSRLVATVVLPCPDAGAATTGTTQKKRVTKDAGGTRILYISLLKALGVDVERNLRSPLVGIGQAARRLGMDALENEHRVFEVGGAKLSDGSVQEADGQLAGTPSLVFDAVVITTGTFLRGVIHIGEEQTPAGRFGEPDDPAPTTRTAPSGSWSGLR